MALIFGRSGLLGRGERAVRQAFLGALERLTALPNDGRPPEDPRRILLLRMDRVGDMIVSTPALRAIKRRFPKAELHVLASRSNAQILRGNPDVDAVHVHSPPRSLLALRTLLGGRWDVVADLNSGPSLTSGLIARFARTGVRLSYEKERSAAFYNARLPTDPRAHQAREAMKIAAWLGAPSEDLRYRVFPSAADEREADAALRAAGWRPEGKWVAMHPGNIKKFDNRWPEEKFARLCDLVQGRPDARVILLQGFDEEPLIETILAACRTRPLVLPPLGLLPTACVLKRMNLVVCNSTSTLHLAAAAGVKTLSFLTGYCSQCWRAPGPEHRALVGGSWDNCRDVEVEPAWAVVQEML